MLTVIYKYISFTTPEGYKVRDNKLFDERFLKNNLELYFAMGGCVGDMIDTYCDYVTPYHDDSFTMTSTDGLINLLGDILSTVPADYYYQPHYVKEMNTKLLKHLTILRICLTILYRTYVLYNIREDVYLTSSEYRNDPMFLRNHFNSDGTFEMPKIKKEDIDLEKIELIGYDMMQKGI